MLVAQTPFFHPIELNTGIKQADFYKVFEDDNGRIYLGTSKGLFFFDGQDSHPILTSLDSNLIVTAIYQTQESKTLVGCNNGLICYLDAGQLRPLNIKEGYPQHRITGFAEDDFGNLWFSTYGEGVYFFYEDRLRNIDEDDGLLGNDIYTIEKGSDGEIWIGTDGGINICSFKNNKKEIRSFTRSNGLPDDIVHVIHVDRQGHHWIGMYDHGICRINNKTNQVDFVIKDWNHGIVNCIELFADQELWIGTEGNGVFRYLIEGDILSPVIGNVDFSNAKINDLLKDVEGNIWVVDNKFKLSCANKQFETLALPLQNIQSLFVDKKNKIWIGTEQGVFIWDEHKPKDLKEVLKKHKLNITAIFQDKFENIWIGTFGKGVYLFNEATNTLKYFSEKDGLTNNSVLSIDGVNGHVWLATLGGVTEVDMTKNPLKENKFSTQNFNQNNGLGTNFIYKIFIDSKDRVWFGTDGKGLSVLENGQIKNYNEALLLKQNDSVSVKLKTIYTICEDPLGHIWFSTAKQGVFKFDGTSFERLARKEEVRDKVVTGMAKDKNGNIVMVHSQGLEILDPLTRHLIYYDSEVGLKDIDPNLNAITIDNNGHIWIADQTQLINYIALNEELEIHPRTIINGLSVNYNPVDLTATKKFNYNQNNIVFHYTGLWYTAPKKVKYKYRLMGYDPNWIYSKDNRVSYSNLPPGDYSFEVTSTENEAFHDEPICNYTFSIAKPIWQRIWFILLSLLVLLGTTYLYIKDRDRRKQRVSELQKEKLASQLAALKAQINPHFLFNSFNTLATLIEENQEAAVEYVERLSDFYRSMLQYRDVDVISLQEEIELVKDYAFLLKKRFGDNFKINVNVNGTVAYLAPLSLQTLVENAVKHNIISKSKPLTVDINLENNDYISVSNNVQRKMQPERSTGFGLQSLTRRYELLSNKKIKIEKSDTSFKIFVPFIR